MALKFAIDELLINAMIDAGNNGFQLGGLPLDCVMIGKSFPSSLSDVSGVIGISGRVNGSVLVNMSQKIALKLASGMLMESYSVINDDVLDSVGEVANVIGGRLKSSLANSGYPLDNITLPTVIIGHNYFVSHSKGMLVFSVAFNVNDPELTMLQDRIVQLSMTLMTKQIGPATKS